MRLLSSVKIRLLLLLVALPGTAFAQTAPATGAATRTVLYRSSSFLPATGTVRAPATAGSPLANPASLSPVLKARPLPPKAVLQRPPGHQYQIIVKFLDALEARATVGRQLTLTSAATLPDLERAVGEHGLHFTTLQTATEAQLTGLRARAARNTGMEQEDLGGILLATPDKTDAESVWRAAQALRALAQTEYVELHSLDAPHPPPAADIAPTTPLLSSYQGYRTNAGINVDAAWSQYGVKGEGVRVTDCEYMFNENHEDLSGLVTRETGVASYYSGFGADHGTAVSGILRAGENAYGMTGTIPQASYYFYPEYSVLTDGTTQYRPATVAAAIAQSAPGDVVILEMQTTGPTNEYVPAEYDQSVWSPVQQGTAAGVLVVAAAGNGNQNLDTSGYSAYLARGDSGAILVGAGSSGRARLSFSTYGSRVNVQGWGTGVATTGYADLAKYGGDDNQTYTNAFNGTSSATPVVSSAVVLVQSAARKRLGRPLTPAEMRQLLMDTGLPQTSTTTAHIGPLPSLPAALSTMLTRFKPALTTPATFASYYFGDPNADLTRDSDGDGISDLVEYFLGTDPTISGGTDLTRFPKLDNTSLPGQIRYTFKRSQAATGVTWVVEAASSLTNADWQTLQNGVAGTTVTTSGEDVTVSVPTTASASRFLRLKVLR